MTDPIELLASKLARKMKEWDPDNDVDMDDIRYGAAYYINYYSVIVVSLIVGIITGEIVGTALALLAFGTLRKYSGGYHLPTLTSCFLATVLIMSVIPHIHVNMQITVAFTLISLLLVVKFTHRTEQKSKLIAPLVIGSNLIIGSPVVALAFLIQSISLINFKGARKVQ